MSDGSVSRGGGAFAKAVQKTLVRTRTKVLQNLGKADKTADDGFTGFVEDFQKQQATALRLQKEMKHYVTCVKAMTIAARNLYSVILDTYEPDWLDPHAVDSATKSLDMLYMNYEAELIERVNGDMVNYVEKFAPIKEKIHKRRRKLLDYDNARHHHDTVKNAKKKDDMKIAKAAEALNEAHNMFLNVNTELHKELPRFYDYRVDFLASNMNRLFAAETTFHQETGKLTEQLQDLTQTLATTHQEEVARSMDTPGSDVLSKNEESAMDLSSLSVDPSDSSPKTNGDSAPVITHRQPSVTSAPHTQSQTMETPPASHPRISTISTDSHAYERVPDDGVEAHGEPGVQSSTAEIAVEHSDEGQRDYDSVAGMSRQQSTNSSTIQDKPEETPASPSDEPEESEYQNFTTPPPVTTNGSTSYQVVATHAYVAEDDDELSFEAGEVIDVVSFEDPEDQDDGWLMGISTKTNRKGVFPENFTQKVRR